MKLEKMLSKFAWYRWLRGGCWIESSYIDMPGCIKTHISWMRLSWREVSAIRKWTLNNQCPTNSQN